LRPPRLGVFPSGKVGTSGEAAKRRMLVVMMNQSAALLFRGGRVHHFGNSTVASARVIDGLSKMKHFGVGQVYPRISIVFGREGSYFWRITRRGFVENLST